MCVDGTGGGGDLHAYERNPSTEQGLETVTPLLQLVHVDTQILVSKYHSPSKK